MPAGQMQTTFINLTTPDEAKGLSKTVRSHVTRYQWQRQPKKGAKALAYRSRRREQVLPVRSDLPQGERRIRTEGEKEEEDASRALVSAPPIFRILGGGRVDPFRSYPVPWRPFVPPLVDHCKCRPCLP